MEVPKIAVVEVVVVSSEVVLEDVLSVDADEPPSSLLAQEMTVRLKRDMRIMYKTFFIMFFFSNYFLVGDSIIGLLQLQQVNLLIGDTKLHIFLIDTRTWGIYQ